MTDNNICAVRSRRRNRVLRWLVGIAVVLGWLQEMRAATNATDPAALQLRWSKGDSFLRHAETVWGGNFSPDGRLVVTTSGSGGCSAGSACVWDLQTKTRISTLQKRASADLSCSVFSPDGKSVLTAGENGLLVLWDPLTGKQIRTFDKGPITSMYVKYFPNGTQVLTASQWGNDPGMHVWDVASGKIVASFKMPKRGVASFDISPDGKTIVTGDQNSEFSVRLWSLNTLSTLWEFPQAYLDQGGIAVWGVAFSENGKLIAAATIEGCYILESATGKIVHRLPEIASGNGAAFLPGDDYLLCTDFSADCVSKYDVRSGKRVASTPKVGGGPLGLNLSRDKTRAVVGAFDRSARIIDTRELSDQKLGLGLFDYPVACTVTPDGGRVITLHSEGGLRWWNAVSGDSVTGAVNGPVRLAKPSFMQMAPDGRTLLFQDGTTRDFLAMALSGGQIWRTAQPESDRGRVGRVAWVSTQADESIYVVVSNGFARLNLQAGALSQVGGVDAPNPLISREVVATRTGALFLRSIRGTSSFTICVDDELQPSNPFALESGYALARCVAVPGGLWLLVAKRGSAGDVRLASYQIQKEEVVPAEALAALADALGAPTFREREEAQRALVRLGRVAIPTLAKACQSSDPEIQVRARPVFVQLSEDYRYGKRPTGVVDICPSGSWILDLQVSADGRRWVAIFGRALIMGRLDAGSGVLSVVSNSPFLGEMIQAAVFDDCRRCLTMDSDKTISVWDMNWRTPTDQANPGTAVTTSR